jgi:hypothetical protein
MAVTNLCPDRAEQILGNFVRVGSKFFTLKICLDRRKFAPNSPNISKFGLRWACLGVALHVIEAAKPSQPLPLPIHHQYVTWWHPMWPRTRLSVRIGHLGVPSKPHHGFCSDGIWETPTFSVQSDRMGIRVLHLYSGVQQYGTRLAT